MPRWYVTNLQCEVWCLFGDGVSLNSKNIETELYRICMDNEITWILVDTYLWSIEVYYLFIDGVNK